MPTNDQFDKLLQKTLDSDVLSLGVGRNGRTGRLSEEGARVVKAFREVIEAIRDVSSQKNGAASSISFSGLRQSRDR